MKRERERKNGGEWHVGMCSERGGMAFLRTVGDDNRERRESKERGDGGGEGGRERERAREREKKRHFVSNLFPLHPHQLPFEVPRHRTRSSPKRERCC